MRYLALLLLVGCAGPDELEVGVGRSFRDGGFTVSDGFVDDSDQANLLVDYEERDVDTVWAAVTWDLKPDPPSPVQVYPPLELPERNESPVATHEEMTLEHLLQMAVALVMGAVGLWGGQKGVKKVREVRSRRKGSHGKEG